MASLPRVIIVENGCQFTLVIQRVLRELHVRSAILSPKDAQKWLTENEVDAVILSGGEASVYDAGAPRIPDAVLRLSERAEPVPVLGICYGMQALAHQLGGRVEAVHGQREYGPAEIRRLNNSPLFMGTPLEQPVFASHGDSVMRLPPGFEPLAESNLGGLAGMADYKRRIYGLQFHPEVADTPFGEMILSNFLFHVANCQADWQPGSMIDEVQQRVSQQVGSDLCVFGFSGGVDSTTIATILSPVLGDRLLCITIDGGHLRENELAEIRHHADAAGIHLLVIDAADEFQAILSKITDAEAKRNLFKQVYASVFHRQALSFGARFLIQGTLAPDRIESGATGGALIKSHHNVGLVIDGVQQLHPIDHLFKYEVRALAQSLGLPASVYNRQPFPGPGLFLRVVGSPATTERLETVRWADARVREIANRHGIHDQMSQLVVALCAVPTVGVKGSGRVYGPSIVVRGIETVDFMTGRGYEFPAAVRREIKAVLCQDPRIVRVWFDEMDKPPATTEME